MATSAGQHWQQSVDPTVRCQEAVPSGRLGPLVPWGIGVYITKRLWLCCYGAFALSNSPRRNVGEYYAPQFPGVMATVLGGVTAYPHALTTQK